MTRSKKSNKKNRGQHGSRKAPDAEVEDSEEARQLYHVGNSAELGRYLIASRSLASGETILEDDPLVVGPCQEAKPLCLGCYLPIDLSNSSSYHRCKTCHWPLCGATCPGLHAKYGHSKGECDLLAQSKSTALPSDTWYYAITPLRCLVLQNTDQPAWEVVINMESHDDIRRSLPHLWESNQRLVVGRIRDSWGFSQFSEDDIHRVCGVLEVNSFEVGLSGPQSLRAIYPRSFLFAHDCVPNTTHSDSEGYHLVVRSSVSVPAQATLTVSYTYTLQSTLKRRKHLRDTKFFSCVCRRCKDVTELGTYAGALRCPMCKGIVLPEDPLDDNAEWKCISCRKYKMTADAVLRLMDRLSEELDAIDGNDVVGYEKFLQQYSSLLHENHYHCLSALHSLSQLYGKVTGFLINDLNNQQIERKVEICRQLLDVFSVLEPGRSRQRGILLYELQAPLMLQVRRISEKISKKELKIKLREISKYLEESSNILEVENRSSSEYSIAVAAKEALRSLAEWQNFISIG